MGNRVLTLRHSPAKIQARLEFAIERSPEELRAIRSALIPESRVGKRTKMSVRLVNRGKKLILSIASSDLVSMRASMNSNLRLVASAIRTIESLRLEFPE